MARVVDRLIGIVRRLRSKAADNSGSMVKVTPPAKPVMSEFELGSKFGAIESKLETGNRRFENLSAELSTVDKKVDDVSAEIGRLKVEMWRAIALAALASALGSATLGKLFGAFT